MAPSWKMFISFFAGMLLSPQAFSAEIMSLSGNKHINNFSEAKRELHRIYSGHQRTLYCGCPYYGKEVNMNSCKSFSPGQGARFKKLEWEHVVPADKLGEVVKSWSQGDVVCKKKKGRKCAAKASPLFRQMEADMYNLYPESGGINGARSNKPPRESLSGNLKTFGQCETVVGKDGFVPRAAVRGEIARTYLYMKDTYGIPLSDEEVALFQKWSGQDPVDSWECERARRIRAVQGNQNKSVEEPCLRLGL